MPLLIASNPLHHAHQIYTHWEGTSNAHVIIKNDENEDFCMDVKEAKYEIGTYIHVWWCHTGDSQKFKVAPSGKEG